MPSATTTIAGLYHRHPFFCTVGVGHSLEGSAVVRSWEIFFWGKMMKLGWGGDTGVQRSCFPYPLTPSSHSHVCSLGSCLFALSRLKNIMQCCVLFAISPTSVPTLGVLLPAPPFPTSHTLPTSFLLGSPPPQSPSMITINSIRKKVGYCFVLKLTHGYCLGYYTPCHF